MFLTLVEWIVLAGFSIVIGVSNLSFAHRLLRDRHSRDKVLDRYNTRMLAHLFLAAGGFHISLPIVGAILVIPISTPPETRPVWAELTVIVLLTLAALYTVIALVTSKNFKTKI